MKQLSRNKSLLIGSIILIATTAGTVGVLRAIRPIDINARNGQSSVQPNPEDVVKKGHQLTREGKHDEAITHFEIAKELFATEDNQLGVDNTALAIERVKAYKVVEATNKLNQVETIAPAPAYDPSR